MLTASGWGEVLHVRELAVGAAAMNTMSQIGAFLMPYAWGVCRDATGSYQSGLMGLFAVTVGMATLLCALRRQLLGSRSAVIATA
jgi:ACS family tartrate transporter-like MFS transporter